MVLVREDEGVEGELNGALAAFLGLKGGKQRFELFLDVDVLVLALAEDE